LWHQPLEKLKSKQIHYYTTSCETGEQITFSLVKQIIFM
jgi:hypothetical protein